jgi:hypothetical protein
MRIAGSWTVARPFGVPIRLHWSIPVCALLAGGLRVAPGAWLAYLLLVLIHEAGHAFVVRRVGARALALDVLGFGGLCWWEGSVTPIQRACIAWGGVWAQMVVLAVTGACVLLLGMPDPASGRRPPEARPVAERNGEKRDRSGSSRGVLWRSRPDENERSARPSPGPFHPEAPPDAAD